MNGEIEIQIRDLDQTVIGNPAHDLMRLSLSLSMAARSLDLPGLTTAMMIEVMIDGYIHGLLGHPRKDGAENIAPIKTVMRSATNRKWKHLAEEHLTDVTPKIPLGDNLWPLTKEESRNICLLFEEKPEQELVRNLTGGKTMLK
jgi:uncharacterized protein (DUF2252 family)